jgi:hypothetical protein
MKRLLEVVALLVVVLSVVRVAVFATPPVNDQVDRYGIPVAVDDLPFYRPAEDEPVAYVAERFGLSVDEFLIVNPHLEEGGIVTRASGALLPLQPVSVDVAGLVVVRDFGITGFEVPSADVVLGFLDEKGREPIPLFVDLVPTVVLGSREGSTLTIGWSLYQGDDHYAVVYLSNPGGVSQRVFLWHELCHKALDSSDEALVNVCAHECLDDM